MAAWTTAARQAANFARHSTPRSASTSAQASILIQRRGLAASGGSKFSSCSFFHMFSIPIIVFLSALALTKFVIVSLAGCGLLFYGGYKFFTRGKKDKNEEEVRGAH